MPTEAKFLGKYELSHAKRIIRLLEEKDLRFFISADNSNLTAMNPITAHHGGHFGTEAHLDIFIASDDYDGAKKIADEYTSKNCKT